MEFEEIVRRREELVRAPLHALPASRVEAIVESLRRKTPRSGELAARAAKVIPGGQQHMLSNKKPYPLTVRRALGSRLTDEDGNEYVDYLMMAGPILLGHNYPPLLERVAEAVLQEGIGCGWTSRWEILAAEKIVGHIRSVDRVRFFQSGTEADMAAVRVARACTGRRKIVRVGGSYHGWADEFTYDMHIPHAGPFQCHGIPPEHYANVLSVPPNDAEALEGLFRGPDGAGIAAVILEALGGESGALPADPAFVRLARDLCTRHGALLIFDEVVTAFRLAMGGAQEVLGIDADLTVLGKVLTHGFPSCGALGGRAGVMDCISGFDPGRPQPFLAGTLAANVVSTCASYWTLTCLEEESALRKAAGAAERLTAGLNDLFEARGFPFFAYNHASIVHFETAAPLAVDIRQPGGVENALARKAAVDDLAVALLDQGIVTKYGNRAFTCMAHAEEDIQRTLASFETVLGMIPAA